MMLIKTTFIMVFLLLAFTIISVSNFNEGIENSDLKIQLQKGGFLKSYDPLNALDMAAGV